jgi:type IV pilus assembly protein PilQ
MMKQRVWILAAAVIIVAATGFQAAIAGTETAPNEEGLIWNLLDLRVDGGSAERPVVTLAMDGPGGYEVFNLEDPDRLVLDLHGVVSQLERHSFSVGAAGVVRARAGQYTTEPNPVSRVVFDLEHPVSHEVRDNGDGTISVVFGAAAADNSTVLIEPEAVLLPVPVAEEPQVIETAQEERAMGMDAIEKLLSGAPELADESAPQAAAEPQLPTSFRTQKIVTDATVYTGKKISLNLVDADIKQVFRLFHDLSGLNFVLDPSVNGRVTLVLDNVPWDQALDLILKNNGLDKILEANVIRIATTNKLAQEAAQRKQLKEAKEMEVEPVTITRTLSYAKADDVEKVIRNGGVLTDRGKVIIDERTNTLIISDIPKRIEPLDQLINTLDTETPQVMIEARIIETSRTFSRDIGVQWGFTAAADAAHGTSTGLGFPSNAAVGYGLNLGSSETGDVSSASALSMSFGNVLDSFTLDIALDALETSGQGRILSSPKIATQNNEEAEIEQGVRIPVVNTTATEINVEFVSASLKLTVTPQITAEGTIILDITVENNSPDFNNTVGDVPPINTQRAQTKVLVADGGTTVIGGIFTVNEGTSETGVPWFRKIPVFGWLFKQTSLRNENRELLIFITPKIMRIG